MTLKKFSLLFLLTIFFASCNLSNSTRGNQEFGVDAEYFIGLQKLAEGKTNEAINKFLKCSKKGSYYCARRSTEELTKIADAKSKSKAIEKLLHRFPDSASYLLASKHYFLLEDYEKIIRITQKIDFATEKDELIKMRLISLNKKNFESYNDEVFKWFTICPISKEHYQFYRDFYNPSNSYTSVQASPHDKIINFRIAVYKRDYLAALEMTNQLFEYFSESQTTPSAQIASDIGKAFLYGSEDFSQNAVLFSSYAQKFKNTDAEFYFWFYAGRFYEKAGLYQKRTHDCFENAINSTKDLKLKDNALWYQMDAQLKISVDKTVENILNYAKRWNDSSYFEDFFERLLSVLLTSGRWAQIPTVYKQIDGYASDEITAKYAFIYAQLLKQNIISSPEAEQEIQKAFVRALKSGSNTYYKIQAAKSLNFLDEQILELLQKPANLSQEKVNPDAEILLKGYAFFGFPEKIYDEFLTVKDVSSKTAFFLSDFLNKCATGKDDFYTQSLRIAVSAAKKSNVPLTLQQLKLIYPQNFSEIVEACAQKYQIPSFIMYALIRSESFFDADVISSAGAIGLTQLMEFTAGDIARKLRVKNYELTDPAINIEFGTYYLAELLSRTNNSYLHAFMSYNAGITRVRRWSKKNLNDELFLEIVPYEETREYGRKLISASTIYELIYK